MKRHPYEYKMMVEYINPEDARRFPHFTHIDDQTGMTKTIEEVFNHLRESLPEGWEVNSHGITTSRNTLIITVLLRRLVA